MSKLPFKKTLTKNFLRILRLRIVPQVFTSLVFTYNFLSTTKSEISIPGNTSLLEFLILALPKLCFYNKVKLKHKLKTSKRLVFLDVSFILTILLILALSHRVQLVTWLNLFPKVYPSLISICEAIYRYIIKYPVTEKRKRSRKKLHNRKR